MCLTTPSVPRSRGLRPFLTMRHLRCSLISTLDLGYFLWVVWAECAPNVAPSNTGQGENLAGGPKVRGSKSILRFVCLQKILAHVNNALGKHTTRLNSSRQGVGRSRNRLEGFGTARGSSGSVRAALRRSHAGD